MSKLNGSASSTTTLAPGEHVDVFDGPQYQPPKSGLLAHIPASWVPYGELMRIDKPTGIYLFYFPHLFGTLHRVHACGSSTVDAWPVERVGAGLEQLATLHATTGGSNPLEKYPWAVPQIREIIINMLSKEEWNKRFAPEAAPPVPESLINRPRIEAAFKTLWKQTPVLTSVIHGDCHSGNTFLNSSGEPGFLDWQGPHVGPALGDVAYFLVGALTVEDRRASERALLSQYLKALHVAGGPRLTVEDVWKEYQYQHVHGFVWPLSGPLMQPREIVDEMSRRHCAAIEDHKSIEILEGLPNYTKVE